MSKDYEVLQLEGTSKEVYEKVAPFSMNRSVIRSMGGYPILTDSETTWFIVVKKGNAVAISAIKIRKGIGLLTYAYTRPEDRRNGLHSILLNKRIDFAKTKGLEYLVADCTANSLKQLLTVGFEVVRESKEWTKVQIML